MSTEVQNKLIKFAETEGLDIQEFNTTIICMAAMILESNMDKESMDSTAVAEFGVGDNEDAKALYLTASYESLV